MAAAPHSSRPLKSLHAMFDPDALAALGANEGVNGAETREHLNGPAILDVQTPAHAILILMNALADWQTLFAVQAGAAATLTGLVFVAVSINLPRILETPGLPGRAAESMLQFLQVFFVSSALLIPRQPLGALGCEALFLTAFAWIGQLVSQTRYARMHSGHPVKWLMQRVVTTHVASIPLFVASVMIMLGNFDGLFVILGAFFFSFVAGIVGAWVLLIEILR